MTNTQHITEELLQGLDTLRPHVLSGKTKNHELRSLLRRMLMLLETLQNTPHIAPEILEKLIRLFTPLLDAEHGALLKRIAHDDAPEVWQQLQAHIEHRLHLITSAQQDLPTVSLMLQRHCDLLGKPYPNTKSIKKDLETVESYLREHLRQQQHIHQGFSALTTALKDSVKAMDTILHDMGDTSPELKQVQQTLNQPLPEDPAQAQQLLKQTAQYMHQASQKLSQAGQQVKNTMSQQLSQMNKLNQRLKQVEAQALNDPLTGLGNRRKLRQYLDTLASQPAIIMMLDIDHFKKINDTYGHDSGDKVLIQLAKILQISTREDDMVARLGGEEFCIIMTGIDAKQAVTQAENIRTQIQHAAFTSSHGHIPVTISIGIAQRQAEEAVNAWFKRADQALYQAKNNGRNQVRHAATH